MGGRSGSSGGGGGTRVYEKSGGYIDLSDNPLMYGNNDEALSGLRREKIVEFEEKYADAKIEHSRVVDKDGNIYSERKGKAGSVEMVKKQGETGQTGSHNHPREPGVLGGTFSGADVKIFSQKEYDTLRARAKEGTYSISKKENFNADGLIQYEKKFTEVLKKEYRDNNNRVKQQYKKGEITLVQAIEQQNKNFNSYLVKRHNAFISGKQEYGYNYVLERPRRRK